MSPVRWQEYIAIDPEIHHGEPCIKGTRVPGAVIIGSLADGTSPEEIIEQYPHLTCDDIEAAVIYQATHE